MGVFDFVKEAGAKVGIGTTAAEDAAAEAAEAAAEKAAADERAAEVAAKVQARRAEREKAAKEEERLEKFEEAKKAAGLEKYVKPLGIECEIDISYDDGVATIVGTAPDQACRERIILAVGNVQEVEQVRDSIRIEKPEPESQMHVVVSGDTLSKIAKAYYGDAMKYPVIFEANRPMLTDPALIYPGQVLRIPAQ